MKNILVVLLTFSCVLGCKTAETDPDRPLEAPKGYMNETLLKMAYGLGMLDLIESKPPVPDDLEAIKDITYKTIEGMDLRLDIYKQKGLKGPAPTMIFVHGGAWKKGKRQDYLPYMIDYAEKGFVTVTLSYRLSGVAKFPAAAQDVNCGIKWVKQHAVDYGIDPDRMVLIGGSAGGHLSLLLGYGGEEAVFNQDCEQGPDSKVKAIVDFYGPVDLTTPYSITTEQVQSFMGVSYEENPDLYKLGSPSTFISPDDPPTLIFQGTIDSLVPVSQSDSLASWLQQAGVAHDYHRLKGWPHTMDAAREVNEYAQFYIDAFLEKYL
ncbi:alpha/beta hydrolase [Cyclobacterium qasimii]|uniref:Lipase n=2 Tax=Cyclobacterium qasimii TaxID=1350429 RepID=A0A512C913_9BACT|nr:alpha/beta hydrolase [Cyclobacterium qasimii]EPR71142.1 putative lipase [Cyclobacterium qasimii M12-11B]GEO20670.1 lipase [Cyclobacterium qasimii]